jgi:hypothetical protein
MQPKKLKPRRGPERQIQDEIIKFLTLRKWFIMETHGNIYQVGFPDLYATHYTYGPRWIEVKNPGKYEFTPAQCECFPKLSANGTRIWILTAATEAEYAKLFGPPNWHIYMMAKL